MSALLRAAAAADIDELLRVQAACHAPELLESAACLRSIVAHGVSQVALSDASGAGGAEAVCGYALCHPGATAALGALLPPPGGDGTGSNGGSGAGDSDASSFFLHDVAVAPAARGAGVAHALVRAVLAAAAARGAREAHLVALPGTAPLWSRFGFAPCDEGAFADAASYGPGAAHMRAQLPQPAAQPP
jgi:GNAT superfamily N-acetyltransferase